MEDAAWLRKTNNRCHINVAELEAVIKALYLAAAWRIQTLTLMTDSKTVTGWLHRVVSNTSRVRVAGLHKLVLERHLEVIRDILQTTQRSLTVAWVLSERNRANTLTRVPNHWLSWSRKSAQASMVAAAPSLRLERPNSYARIRAAQRDDPVLVEVVQQLTDGNTVTDESWRRGQGQHSVVDGVLYWQHQDHIEKAKCASHSQ